MDILENSTKGIFTTTEATLSTLGSHISALLTFSWMDYTLFSAMFGISAVIGIYFGCFGSKQATTKEYLLGGKSMGTVPIAMSLIASNLSGISLLGIPAEIYMYGTQYWACLFCSVAVVVSMIYIYLPVFHKLQLNSSYAYLSQRFDKSIRNIASAIYLINALLYVPIVIYIPALAFNQVSGINLHLITPIVCVICIFYTTLGGLKAVVWTDTFQFSITIISMLAVFLMDSANIADIGAIWEKAEESGRIEFFNLDLDPTARCTFWGIVIGMSTMWIAHCGIHQCCVQRYLALPSLKDARKSALIFGVGVIVTKSLSCFSGLIMYYKYHDCDPITSGKVHRMDQILPYYVLDVASKIPGLSGVFVSGVFSTALSTMSTSLNTLAGTIYEDFLVHIKMLKIDDKSGSTIMKVLVVVLGVICVGLVYLVENLGGVIQVSTSFSGITGGPLLGLFTLGMLFPSANTKGALYGSATAFLFVAWMCLGQQIHTLKGSMESIPKPLSIEGCPDYLELSNLTTLTTMAPERSPEVPFILYRVSFYWYAFIGLIITITVGLIISHITKDEKAPPVNKDYLSPCIYAFLPTDYPGRKDNHLYTPVEVKLVEDDIKKDCRLNEENNHMKEKNIDS